MNIKSIASNILTFQIRPKKEERKMEASTERDAHPEYSKGDEHPKRHMTEEELASVLETLRALPGVKENNLIVRLAKDGGTVRVFVEDHTGKVVRRIPEQDLWALLKKKAQGKGNILDKAM